MSSVRIVSEYEAKKLICPFLAVPPHGGGGGSSLHRHCLGSYCMMWQEARLPGKGYLVTKDGEDGKPVSPADEPLGEWELQDSYAGQGRSGWRDSGGPGGYCGLVCHHR